MIRLQSKLDDLYLKKAQRAYIRSRAKWIEDGEKNSSYFSRLEKTRQERNALTTLNINNKIVTDPKEIDNEVHYILQYIHFIKTCIHHPFLRQTDIFFKKVDPFIPKIDPDFKMTCDSDLKIEEIDTAIKKMALGKSPGQDGLTTNFYRFFWSDIREMLFGALKECLESNTLLITMKQAIIVLIPKPKKDKTVIDNLRPITLLNVDYKIFTNALASRLKSGIGNIISDTQSGFLPNRLIHNNIRLVLDLIDYSHLLEDDGIILFLDFFKAFDKLEHRFILQSLQHFGFGRKFINIISMLYKQITSAVLLQSGTTRRFDINRGIRQGDPVSPLLFLLAVELLALYIKNNESIKPLNVLGRSLVVTQLA